MGLFANGRLHMSPGRLITLSIVAVITLASIVLMLSCASPELIWDEADYAANTDHSWYFLWHGSSYSRHGHGPMSIYLAKLGQDILPADLASIEVRLRFFIALVGSLAVGMLYWMLRYCFKTSQAAALVGSCLLLFSVIRLGETHIIGPHHLMLACTLAIVALGYMWRDRPTLQAALGLGVVMALGAVSMTYVIPLALCWAVAVFLTGKGWFSWDRAGFKVSWAIPVMLVTIAVVLTALWPPALRHFVIIHDFKGYLHFPPFPTLVGGHILEVPPRSVLFYWLAHLDAPILLFSSSIILVALWKAYRTGHLSSKHAYLAVFLAFFLVTMLTAHIAGARNMLQFIGVLCLTTGALFDEAVGHRPKLIRFVTGAAIVLAGLNLLWLSQSSSYTPGLATDGYRAFLRENKSLLAEKSKAIISGVPILNFYAQQSNISVAWDITEIPWYHPGDPDLPADIQYALMPAYIYNGLPADQPILHFIVQHWKVVWSFKANHAWELRLYEKPTAGAP